MTDLAKAAPGIVIDLRYTRADNFFKTAFYPEGSRALLRPAAAAKIAKVQAELAEHGLGLKIWDAYRPLAVQRAMWKVMPDPRYVADPEKGGRHNRGAAVDVTLVEAATGKELAMPTAHDDFSEKAAANFKLLAPEVFANRQRLQDAMVKHGFAIFESEWWHFDDADWQQYEALDLPIAEVSAAAAKPRLLQPDEPHLLVLDSRVIYRSVNATLRPGSVSKEPRNPLFIDDKPWENALNNLYPNVLWDEEEQLFKMWYKCVLSDKEVIARMDQPSTVHDVGWYLLYATSKDGLTWSKPELGLHKFNGDARTNIVARDTPNVGVFKDSHDADPSRRYKMVYDTGLGQPKARFSADGIHWSEPVAMLGFSARHCDTHNNAFWDERSGKYVWFTKLYLGERLVSRLESEDFLHWKPAGVVLRSSIAEGRAHQTYAMPSFRYGSIYLGYVMMYHVGKDRSVDCELAWSPDSITWQRVAPGQPLLGLGPKGSYDSQCIYAMSGPPIAQGDDLMLFYGGDDFPHTGWKRACVPCLARLPLDRFAGYEQQEQSKPATLFTAQLTVTDEPLRLSADVPAGGKLRVAALDELGVTLDDTLDITSSITQQPVTWRHDGLAKLKGMRLHLQFELTGGAKLYALRGLELVNQALPKPLNPLRSPHRKPAPLATHRLTFDQGTEGWKGTDKVEHNASGYLTISRSPRLLPIAYGPVNSPLSGDWTQRFGGRGAQVSCRVRAPKAGGKVLLELFASDVAQWSYEGTATFGTDWSEATAKLRYDWSDEEAQAAGWRRSTAGFSWAETITQIGKLVITAGAAGAQERFDLDELRVEGWQ